MSNVQLAPPGTCRQQSTAEERLLRREIVHYTRALAKGGFAPGTAGNVSARLAPDRILITPTGRSKASVRTGDVITVNMAGQRLAGTASPSSELAMHLAIYWHRPDVAAVIHAHPPVATAFACCGKALDRVLCQEAAMTIGPVPLAAYATTGTAQVASHLLQYLPDHDAILLANHGAVAYGPSVEKAFHNLEVLEHLAQVHLIAHQLGSPVYLEQDQLEALQRSRHAYLIDRNRDTGTAFSDAPPYL